MKPSQPSTIDDATVDKIAELARLEFDDASKAEIKSDLNRILKFVDQLSEVDTEGVEPLIYMMEEEDQLRSDKVDYSISQQKALKNSPDKDSDYIKVPTVLRK